MMTDWDVIAAECGLPLDWRESGFDTPEYMDSTDSLYRHGKPTKAGFACVWPNCSFKTKDLETMFRHAHGGHNTER